MKCPHCGVDYSDKVYNIHKNLCDVKEEVANDEEAIRDMAKEKGISHYWNKSIDTLKEELSEVL